MDICILQVLGDKGEARCPNFESERVLFKTGKEKTKLEKIFHDNNRDRLHHCGSCDDCFKGRKCVCHAINFNSLELNQVCIVRGITLRFENTTMRRTTLWSSSSKYYCNAYIIFCPFQIKFLVGSSIGSPPLTYQVGLTLFAQD